MSALAAFLGEGAQPIKLALCASKLDNRQAEQVSQIKNSLAALGYPYLEVDLDSPALPTLETDLQSVSAVCLVGSEAFSLLEKVRACGLDTYINRALTAGKQYIGVDAAATIAGPEIGMLATVGKPLGTPETGPTKGLSLVNFIPLPHFSDDTRYDFEAIIDQYRDVYNFVTFTDTQAITVSQEGFRRIILSE